MGEVIRFSGSMLEPVPRITTLPMNLAPVADRLVRLQDAVEITHAIGSARTL